MANNLVAPVLAAVADVIRSALPVAGLVDAGVYVWPDQTTRLDLSTVATPTVIVSRHFGEVERVWREVIGRAMWEWRVEVDLIIAPLPQSQEMGGAAEEALYRWDWVVESALWQAMTLGGLVRQVGEYGDRLTLCEVRRGGLVWFGRSFFGAVFVFPVLQTIAQDMSA